MSDEVAPPSRASERAFRRGIVASKRSGKGGENASGEIRPRLTVRAVRPATAVFEKDSRSETARRYSPD